MKTTLIVFVKEVRENLRDRRTVINTLVTGPLLAPLVFALMINAVATREIARPRNHSHCPLSVPRTRRT